MEDGCKLFMNDEAVRASFVRYIKSGIWSDSLKSKSITQELRLAKENKCLIYLYKMPSSDYNSVSTTMKLNHCVPLVVSTLTVEILKGSNKSVEEVTASEKKDQLLELYPFLRATGFTPEQLLQLLFSIIISIYVESPSYCCWVQRSAMQHIDDLGSLLVRRTAVASVMKVAVYQLLETRSEHKNCCTLQLLVSMKQ